ncbi:hypothetical protein [Neobacillus dielmonensis]|uniref:hypothetical protein n=1 Tax=Neobacillus dielmonensis TaxID=1347369 RepID=UPI0005A8FC3F|nr:hypothetical protein [Neobacillus dielmonensis]
MRVWFRFFTKNNALETKICELEKKLAVLETKVNIVKEKEAKLPDKEPEPDPIPSIHVENLTVEKIIIEHLDYANNFGQLGIKELTGKLNIGTSYEGDFSKEFDKKVNELVQNKLGNEPRVNLKPKKE